MRAVTWITSDGSQVGKNQSSYARRTVSRWAGRAKKSLRIFPKWETVRRINSRAGECVPEVF